MTALRRVYLDGTDLERDCEALMRFRLTYDGPLKSSQPTHKSEDANGQFRDRRAEHKHDIRRKMHEQLKQLWATNKFLQILIAPNSHITQLPPSAGMVWGEDPSIRRPMATVLSEAYSHHREHGYGYVPLAREEIYLECSLRVLCLRRDHHDAVLPARDIDNRIKTLIDALTMPSLRQGVPLKDGKPRIASDDEKPFFVLMDDDRRVTHLEVETGIDLAPPPADADESFVRLVISVELRTYYTTMFNLGFA